jgi:hypothetical protein
LSKVAAWAVSVTAVVLPFEMVTQIPPVTLVEVPQPVWKPTGMPPAAVVPVIL